MERVFAVHGVTEGRRSFVATKQISVDEYDRPTGQPNGTTRWFCPDSCEAVSAGGWDLATLWYRRRTSHLWNRWQQASADKRAPNFPGAYPADWLGSLYACDTWSAAKQYIEGLHASGELRRVVVLALFAQAGSRSDRLGEMARASYEGRLGEVLGADAVDSHTELWLATVATLQQRAAHAAAAGAVVMAAQEVLQELALPPRWYWKAAPSDWDDWQQRCRAYVLRDLLRCIQLWRPGADFPPLPAASELYPRPYFEAFMLQLRRLHGEGGELLARLEEVAQLLPQRWEEPAAASLWWWVDELRRDLPLLHVNPHPRLMTQPLPVASCMLLSLELAVGTYRAGQAVRQLAEQSGRPRLAAPLPGLSWHTSQARELASWQDVLTRVDEDDAAFKHLELGERARMPHIDHPQPSQMHGPATFMTGAGTHPYPAHLNVTRKAGGSLMERHTAGARLQRPAGAVPAGQQQLWASQQAVWEREEWEVLYLSEGVPLTHAECDAAGFPQYRMAARAQAVMAELGHAAQQAAGAAAQAVAACPLRALQAAAMMGALAAGARGLPGNKLALRNAKGAWRDGLAFCPITTSLPGGGSGALYQSPVATSMPRRLPYVGGDDDEVMGEAGEGDGGGAGVPPRPARSAASRAAGPEFEEWGPPVQAAQPAEEEAEAAGRPITLAAFMLSIVEHVHAVLLAAGCPFPPGGLPWRELVRGAAVEFVHAHSRLQHCSSAHEGAGLMHAVREAAHSAVEAVCCSVPDTPLDGRVRVITWLRCLRFARTPLKPRGAAVLAAWDARERLVAEERRAAASRGSAGSAAAQ